MGRTYYWQVRANNSLGSTYANGSETAYWSFTVGLLPGAFSKTSPADGAINQPVSLSLSWGTSSGATSYEYCYDSTNDGACSTWLSTGTTTSAPISGLAYATSYYWQVRALNSIGSTYANSASTAFWSFTTAIPEMDVQGNGTSIGDGDSTPSLTDGTDFGSTAVLGAISLHNFTIYNTGPGDLILSGHPAGGNLGDECGGFHNQRPAQRRGSAWRVHQLHGSVQPGCSRHAQRGALDRQQ